MLLSIKRSSRRVGTDSESLADSIVPKYSGIIFAPNTAVIEVVVDRGGDFQAADALMPCQAYMLPGLPPETTASRPAQPTQQAA